MQGRRVKAVVKRGDWDTPAVGDNIPRREEEEEEEEDVDIVRPRFCSSAESDDIVNRSPNLTRIFRLSRRTPS